MPVYSKSGNGGDWLDQLDPEAQHPCQAVYPLCRIDTQRQPDAISGQIQASANNSNFLSLSSGRMHPDCHEGHPEYCGRTPWRGFSR